ncbi:hypothetical protein [Pelagibius sp. Alg239-R121]|nr:hypothetical protein [Pelagibius sp. Alg239-R121]
MSATVSMRPWQTITAVEELERALGRAGKDGSTDDDISFKPA